MSHLLLRCETCFAMHIARHMAELPRSECLAQKSIALPDMHSGYGFAIGNVAAFDMGNPEAVVSPGGVGFDINCGVRLIRTNLVRHSCPLANANPPTYALCCALIWPPCSAVQGELIIAPSMSRPD